MTDGLHAHERAPDLVLARLHLRLGSLSLARAELETLAGRDALDEDGLVDLAEARWRTGDITGAGEAAVAALHDEDGPLVALVVAAEAAAARGRPTEASRLATRAMALADGSIDTVFAGMPRGPAWPADAAAPPPSPTTMFDPPHGPAPSRPRPPRRPRAQVRKPAPVEADPSLDPTPPVDPATIGMWDGATETGTTQDATLSADEAADAEIAAEADAQAEASLPAGDEALHLGRAALDAGDVGTAVVHFSYVLRLSPVLAPAVIDLVADRPERGLAFVRGDAYRLVGRELEALRAYADAARTDPDPDQPTEGDPA